MPEEPLVVALGERRYRVERRWCRPSEQEPLGFVSDLVVDSGGFVHVGQRGTESPGARIRPHRRIRPVVGQGCDCGRPLPVDRRGRPDPARGSGRASDPRLRNGRQAPVRARRAPRAPLAGPVQSSDGGFDGAGRRGLRLRRIRKLGRASVLGGRGASADVGRERSGLRRVHHSALCLGGSNGTRPCLRPRERPGFRSSIARERKSPNGAISTTR